jgi:LacI family transcriptional regulator
MRATIKDISRKMGVSTTTVTKALNGKPKVSEGVRRQILEAAEEMGYMPNRSAKALSRSTLSIGIVYPRHPVEFYSDIQKGLEKGIADLLDFRVKGEFRAVDGLNSVSQMRDALTELMDSGIDGIIFSPGFDHQEYRDLMDRIAGKGIPILYLVNDVPGRESMGCVRMNGIVAGRMAAQFLRFCIGRDRSVVVLSCNKEILTQKECISGFLEEAKGKDLCIKGVYETQDDKNVAYYLTEKIVKDLPDVKGIYVSSYNSVAVCKCLEDMGRSDDVFVVGQDLFPELVEKLDGGSLKATLFQDPYRQGRIAVEMMYDRLTGAGSRIGDNLITPRLVMTSNMGSYLFD